MRKLSTTSCGLLLACFWLAACASPEHPKKAYSWEDRKEVVTPQLYTLKAHRREDYSGRYYYEEDRYARMTRWHDPVYRMRKPVSSDSAKAVVLETASR